jgi:hypothetical protein
MLPMTINLDAYYRGLAAERLQRLSDELLELSQQAAKVDADAAAWRLSSLATELLEQGIELKRSCD